MDNRTSWILGTGIVGVAFVLFFIFVYQPKAREAGQTTRVDQLLRPSTRFYEDPLRFVPEYRFMSHTGDSIGSADMRGRVYVVDFFFTNCTAACPMMSSQMTRVQKAYADRKDFGIISFSLDPDKDTLPALRDYAEKLEAVPGSWYFLRGPRSEVYPLGEEASWPIWSTTKTVISTTAKNSSCSTAKAASAATTWELTQKKWIN